MNSRGFTLNVRMGNDLLLAASGEKVSHRKKLYLLLPFFIRHSSSISVTFFLTHFKFLSMMVLSFKS